MGVFEKKQARQEWRSLVSSMKPSVGMTWWIDEIYTRNKSIDETAEEKCGRGEYVYFKACALKGFARETGKIARGKLRRWSETRDLVGKVCGMDLQGWGHGLGITHCVVKTQSTLPKRKLSTSDLSALD